jgi:hypothetical protein
LFDFLHLNADLAERFCYRILVTLTVLKSSASSSSEPLALCYSPKWWPSHFLCEFKLHESGIFLFRLSSGSLQIIFSANVTSSIQRCWGAYESGHESDESLGLMMKQVNFTFVFVFSASRWNIWLIRAKSYQNFYFI